MDDSMESSDGTTTDDYFSSYDSLQVHELMLKDKPRTLAYKHFIEKNASLFADKVVLDVGAGTGILSLFAAKAGAKKVYAIEASNMADVCEVLVEQNGYSDTITVIKARVEDVTLPGSVKADIIISEWMGFYLLHESMLSSVLHARDNLLKSDGLIFPSTASLYLCPVSIKEHFNDSFLFWQNVYGFDFSPVLPAVQAKRLSEPEIMELSTSNLTSQPELVTHLDLKYVEADDLALISGMHSFSVNQNGVIHGLACWFDVGFDGDVPVTLSTGPDSPVTHWKQTVVLLPQPLLVSKGEEIEVNLSLSQDKVKPRRYNITVDIIDEASDGDGDDDDKTDGEIHEHLYKAMDPHCK